MHIIPGDPVIRILGMHATEAQVEQLRHELGLDMPLIVQYGTWIGNVFQGDLGRSFIFHEDVAALITERFPVTFYLTFLALSTSTMVGIIAGVISGVKRGTFIDSFITLFANVGIAVPTFWLGILGIYLFGMQLGWLPIEGWISPLDDFWQSTRKVIMPVATLAVPNIAIVARQTRSSMLESIHQDYIRTAVSKGLAQRIVFYKHALRNALIPVVTLLGIVVVFLIGGEVLTETVFNIPGVGRLLVRAALDNDYLIVQGIVLVVGVIVVFTNLFVDIAYGWIDPRIRYR
jgi:peptide/nickel transport system permease protein